MLAEVERNVEWIVEESNDGYHFVASESAAVRGTVGYCTVKCFFGGRGQPASKEAVTEWN